MNRNSGNLIFLATLLGSTACVRTIEISSPVIDKERTLRRAGTDEELLGPESGWFCPSGFLFHTKYRMCVSDSKAQGPFSNSMIKNCKDRDVGNNFCDENIWPIDAAKDFRGTGECMPGTALDPSLGVCAANDDVFGPFPTDLMDLCHEANKNPASCASMRWSRSTFASKNLKPQTSTNTDKSDFTIDFPNPEANGRKLMLWATFYNLPLAEHVEQGLPLRALSGEKLGPVLDRAHWCDAAMEGSVRIKSGPGAGKTYNYAGKTSAYTVDCSAYFSHAPSGSVKFREAKGRYGDGVLDYKLVPYRTLAVDPQTIPYGTVVYIPAAKGVKVVTPAGNSFVHDGYFFAGDAGGLIKGSHIDVFAGEHSDAPFSFIKSNASATFPAFIVKDAETVRKLRLLHTF